MSSGTQQTPVAEYGAEFDEIAQAMATPEFLQNPYALYEGMRPEQPVYRGTQGVWYLTRYADVEAALHDPRLSTDGGNASDAGSSSMQTSNSANG
jgi:cytochrome P450